MFNPELCFFDAYAGTLPKISWSTFVWLHHEQGSCSPNDWSAQHARQRWAYSNLRAKLLCQWPSVPGPQRLFSWVCQWGWEDMGRHSRLFDTGAIDVSNQPTALQFANRASWNCEGQKAMPTTSEGVCHRIPPETEKQQQRQQKTTHVVPPCQDFTFCGVILQHVAGHYIAWYGTKYKPSKIIFYIPIVYTLRFTSILSTLNLCIRMVFN